MARTGALWRGFVESKSRQFWEHHFTPTRSLQVCGDSRGDHLLSWVVRLQLNPFVCTEERELVDAVQAVAS